MNNFESEINFKLSQIPNKTGFRKLEVIKNIQIQFLVESINNGLLAYESFRNCINDIFKCTSLKILSKENIRIDYGLVVITNHIGINKLTKIYPQDLECVCNNIQTPLPHLENDDPFILLLAPVVETIFKSIRHSDQVEIIFVFMKLAPIYDEILLTLNAVTIERNAPNQYSLLREKVSEKVKEANEHNKKPVVIIFPEGGTSGKSNSGDPYALLKFKDGYKHLSKDFQLNILPIAISTDSNLNYFACVGKYLSVDSSTDEDREYFISLFENKSVI